MIDESKIQVLDDWFAKYKQECLLAHQQGVYHKEVNNVVGEQYKGRCIRSGHTGIVLVPVMSTGRAKEIVIYDTRIIKAVYV